MATNIPNLIGSIIDTIRDTHVITSITNIGTTYTINTANTHGLVAGDYVKINSIEYKITSLVVNTRFTVVSTTAVTGTSWTASAPFYYYGTPLQISNAINKIKDYQKKLPIIVLFETTEADVNDDPTIDIERTPTLQIFFACEANFQDWDWDDYYVGALTPMQLYVDAFIEALEDSPRIGIFKNHKETPYQQWNMERLSTGKNIFDANLSAIGIDINPPIIANDTPDC